MSVCCIIDILIVEKWVKTSVKKIMAEILFPNHLYFSLTHVTDAPVGVNVNILCLKVSLNCLGNISSINDELKLKKISETIGSKTYNKYSYCIY